jgi:opacity protein-like surface antigen
MKKIVPALAVALIAILGASSAAQAAVKVIDFSAGSPGTASITYGGTRLNTSTSFNLDSASIKVTSVGTDDNASGLAVGDPIMFSSATSPPNEIIYGSMPAPVTLVNPFIKTWTDSFGTFTETLTTVESINRGTLDAITLRLTGTIDGPGFDNTPALLILGATQARGPGLGNAISVSLSNTAETSAIPEPSTWVMMGLGFIGLGYAAVRRSSKDRRSALAI